MKINDLLTIKFWNWNLFGDYNLFLEEKDHNFYNL
jgi:hypothetical protein